MKLLKLLALSGMAFALSACGGSKEKAGDSVPAEEEFAQSQPVESGMYEATYFDVKGKDARKGSFDGRVIFSMSPESPAFLVFENGNRTKIKHIVMLSDGFEKNDSIYTATAKNGTPVTLAPDSTIYNLSYINNSDTVTITFDQKAKSVYTPLEALSKIKEEAGK
ncbi:MAG: hypothetical protein K2K93_08285 [Muribaculaceae bacterium]|nr:hypothetical protein [Muribaculaceae bacterium]